MSKLNVGDIFDVTIEKICHETDGLAKFKDEFIFLVSHVTLNEKVKIRVVKYKHRFGICEVIERG